MHCSACGQPLEVSQTICQRRGRQRASMASYAPGAEFDRWSWHSSMGQSFVDTEQRLILLCLVPFCSKNRS
jgi:hypothetical protein